MSSNLPHGYCDETHSWRGFAAGNCGEPPFPSRATPPEPPTPPAAAEAGERERQIREYHRKAHGEGMGYELWGDATAAIGHLLTQLQEARHQAATATREAEAAGEALVFLKRPPTASTVLIWCLRYLDTEGLEYVYDKLQRRCPLGKKHGAVLYPPAPPHPTTEEAREAGGDWVYCDGCKKCVAYCQCEKGGRDV